jgi:hypothetical protein
MYFYIYYYFYAEDIAFIAYYRAKSKPFVSSKADSTDRCSSLMGVEFTHFMRVLNIDEDYYFRLVLGMKMTSPHNSSKEYLILGGENNIKSKFINV